MIGLTYAGEKRQYIIAFKRINDHVVQVSGDFPVKEKGFVCFRKNHKSDNWDYKKYNTIYRRIEGGVQFSDDGSTYVEPIEKEEPEPYIPTLKDIKTEKVAEMNMTQQDVIQNGIDVTLTDRNVEHFTLTMNDQTSLMGLQTQVAAGVERIPWHTSDHAEHCKYYSNADMALIVMAAMQYVSFHVTYFRDLRIYINSLMDGDVVKDVTYGMRIPEEYQSEVLKDMYVAMDMDAREA